MSPTPEQKAARAALLRARKNLRDAMANLVIMEERAALLRARKNLRDAMANLVIMEEVTEPYRDALLAAEAEAERARDEFNRVCGKSAV